MTILVSLYAGPGAGKTTVAAGVFAALKLRSINAEFVPEYAKELTWNNEWDKLSNQFLVTGVQHQRIRNLIGKVDVIVTDSPPELGVLFTDCTWTQTAILAQSALLTEPLTNFRYFVSRDENFLSAGRKEDLEQSEKLDADIKRVLLEEDLQYKTIQKSSLHIKGVVNRVLDIRQRDADNQKVQAKS